MQKFNAYSKTFPDNIPMVLADPITINAILLLIVLRRIGTENVDIIRITPIEIETDSGSKLVSANSKKVAV